MAMGTATKHTRENKNRGVERQAESGMQVALEGTETKRVIAGSGQLSSSCFHSSFNLGCPLGSP